MKYEHMSLKCLKITNTSVLLDTQFAFFLYFCYYCKSFLLFLLNYWFSVYASNFILWKIDIKLWYKTKHVCFIFVTCLGKSPKLKFTLTYSPSLIPFLSIVDWIDIIFKFYANKWKINYFPFRILTAIFGDISTLLPHNNSNSSGDISAIGSKCWLPMSDSPSRIGSVSLKGPIGGSSDRPTRTASAIPAGF